MKNPSQPTQPQPDLLKLSEVRLRLSVSDWKLKRMIARGVFPLVDLADTRGRSRVLRVPRRGFEAVLAALEKKTAQKKGK